MSQTNNIQNVLSTLCGGATPAELGLVRAVTGPGIRGGEKIILGQKIYWRNYRWSSRKDHFRVEVIKRINLNEQDILIYPDMEHGRVHLNLFVFSFEMSGQVMQIARYTVKGVFLSPISSST